MHPKRKKDLRQASQLLSVLIEERPDDLLLAWEKIQREGKAWVRRVKKGCSALERIDSAVPEHVVSFSAVNR